MTPDTLTGLAPWIPATPPVTLARYEDVVSSGRFATRAVAAVTFARPGEDPDAALARLRVACRRARLRLALTVGDAAVADPRHLHADGSLAVHLLRKAVAAGVPVLGWPDPAMLLRTAAVTASDLVVWTAAVDRRLLAAAAS